MKYIVLVISVFSLLSCAPIWVGPGHQNALEPTTEKSELVFVKTGDSQHYYIIDRGRNLCFFHSRLYGKKHLVEISCNKIPEYQSFFDTNASDSPAAVTDKTPQPAGPEKSVPTADSDKAETAVKKAPLTKEDHANYRQVYAKYFCSRKDGEDPELETLLKSHNLKRSAYERLKVEFGKDKSLAESLMKEIVKVCP